MRRSSGQNGHVLFSRLLADNASSKAKFSLSGFPFPKMWGRTGTDFLFGDSVEGDLGRMVKAFLAEKPICHPCINLLKAY